MFLIKWEGGSGSAPLSQLPEALAFAAKMAVYGKKVTIKINF